MKFKSTTCGIFTLFISFFWGGCFPGASTSLEKKSPAIVELFKKFKITADDVSWMAYEVSVQKRDPGEVARDWMSKNKSTVDGWLGL